MRQKISLSHRDHNAKASKNKCKYIEEFICSTGLRRQELEDLCLNDIEVLNDKIIIHVTGGIGGRSREVEALNIEAVLKVYAKAKDNSSGRLFSFTACHMVDIRSTRATFADELYHRVARDVNTLPEDELYLCKKDNGIAYDRKALEIVSKAMGHNHLDSIVLHLYNRERISAALDKIIEDGINIPEPISDGNDPESYSGSFDIQIDPELHFKAALTVYERGMSIDSFVEEAIKRQLELNLHKL